MKETGQVDNVLKLNYFRNFNRGDRHKRERDVEALTKFIFESRAELIVIGAESMDSRRAEKEVNEILKGDRMNELVREVRGRQLPRDVTFGSMEFARLNARSPRYVDEFPEFIPLLRMTVSLGRHLQVFFSFSFFFSLFHNYFQYSSSLIPFPNLSPLFFPPTQDPLTEIASAASDQDTLLCLKLEPLQELLQPFEMVKKAHRAISILVNDCCVDINRAMTLPHAEPLISFVSGLGFRKGKQLLDKLGAVGEDGMREVASREDLRDFLGEKVYQNCIAFLVVQTRFLPSHIDGLNPLDQTRIHPESYSIARKVIRDAKDKNDRTDFMSEKTRRNLREVDIEELCKRVERDTEMTLKTTFTMIRDELENPCADMRIQVIIILFLILLLLLLFSLFFSFLTFYLFVLFLTISPPPIFSLSFFFRSSKAKKTFPAAIGKWIP